MPYLRQNQSRCVTDMGIRIRRKGKLIKDEMAKRSFHPFFEGKVKGENLNPYTYIFHTYSVKSAYLCSTNLERSRYEQNRN